MLVYKLLLDLLPKYKIDAYISPLGDEHFNEIIADSDNRVKFLTGFTGTYGTAITGKENAFLTSLQFIKSAKNEVKEYTVYQEGSEMTTKNFLLKINAKRVGICSLYITSTDFIQLHKDLQASGIELVSFDIDLVDEIWKTKPERKFNKTFSIETLNLADYIDNSYFKAFREFKIQNSGHNYNHSLAGRKYEDKIADIQKVLKPNQGVVITYLGTIAWLFNLRGTDLKYSSSFYSYAYITKENVYLFTNSSPPINGVKIMKYNDFYKFIKEAKEEEMIISGETSFYVYSLLKKPSYTQAIEDEEALKNPIEIIGFKASGIKDGVALVKLFALMESRVNQKNSKLTEEDVLKRLVKLLRKDKAFFSFSFEPLIAFGSNTASIYHKADKTVLQKEDLILMDVGSHYYHGTTDLSRTLHFGTPTKKQIDNYTLALKSLINTKYIQKKVITGEEVDETARTLFKQQGKDYPTGSGHGIGYFSNVHEKLPKLDYTKKNLHLNNVFTIEPSYFDNDTGIRVEDAVFINKKGMSFLQTNLTYVPFHLPLIDNSALSPRERKNLNTYARKMREFLSPLLKNDKRAYKYLIKHTEPLPEPKEAEK